MSSTIKFLSKFDYKVVRVLANKDDSHASLSIVVLVHKNGRHYAAKVFAISQKDHEEALQYEALVYRHLKNFPTLQRNTIAYAEYITAEPDLCPSELDDGTVLKVAAIITTYTLNTITFQHLLDGPLNDDLLRPILFQLIFVIATLSANNIQHNDLRPLNILLANTWSHTIDRNYTFNALNFRLPACLRVLIFDWDLAEAGAPMIGNPILANPANGYTKFGIFPNQINSRLDIYRLLRTLELYELTSLPETNCFMKKVMGGLRNTRVRAPDLLDESGFACHPQGIPYSSDAPGIIMPAAEILLDPYFFKFRR
jgi:serine/threonine protein kinase